MSDINRLSQLLAAVRTSAKRTTDRTAHSANTAPRTAARLGERVVTDLRGVRLDGEEPRANARRRFLQTVLLHELGEDFVNDPAFGAVSREVEQAFSADPELREDLDGLLLRLQRDAG